MFTNDHVTIICRPGSISFTLTIYPIHMHVMLLSDVLLCILTKNILNRHFGRNLLVSLAVLVVLSSRKVKDNGANDHKPNNQSFPVLFVLGVLFFDSLHGNRPGRILATEFPTAIVPLAIGIFITIGSHRQLCLAHSSRK
jgi:hypothetical protein